MRSFTMPDWSNSTPAGNMIVRKFEIWILDWPFELVSNEISAGEIDWFFKLPHRIEACILIENESTLKLKPNK